MSAGRVREAPAVILGAVWWVLLPAIAVLVASLSIERACADPYRLVGGAMSTPLTAWPVSLLYISAHAWLMFVYLHTAAQTGTMWPALRQVRSVWAGDWLKIALMVAALAVEYCPLSLWRAIGSMVPGVCRLS